MMICDPVGVELRAMPGGTPPVWQGDPLWQGSWVPTCAPKKFPNPSQPESLLFATRYPYIALRLRLERPGLSNKFLHGAFNSLCS